MSDEAFESTIPVPDELKGTIVVTALDKLYSWSRRNSVWPMMFGLACCAIEMIVTATSRYDFSRFGMEVMRPSPRQTDLMIVSGTVTKKMVPQIVRLYNQMPEPKYVMAMGACASGGGPFKEGYNVVSGIDKFLPVDVYVPGCPPTPQALLHGLMRVQEKIDGESVMSARWYRAKFSEAVPVPILGPDLMDPREFAMIKERAARRAQPGAPHAGGRRPGYPRRLQRGHRPGGPSARFRPRPARPARLRLSLVGHRRRLFPREQPGSRLPRVLHQRRPGPGLQDATAPRGSGGAVALFDLSRRRVPGTRGLGSARHSLRGASGPAPHPDVGRFRRPSTAQGLARSLFRRRRQALQESLARGQRLPDRGQGPLRRQPDLSARFRPRKLDAGDRRRPVRRPGQG